MVRRLGGHGRLARSRIRSGGFVLRRRCHLPQSIAKPLFKYFHSLRISVDFVEEIRKLVPVDLVPKTFRYVGNNVFRGLKIDHGACATPRPVRAMIAGKVKK